MDDFIRKNAEYFDTEEPPKGHFKRFYSKLSKMSGNTGKIRHMSVLLKIAAVLIIGIFIASMLYFSIKGYYSASKEDNCLNRELCEAEDFYSRQVEQYYQRIEKMPFNHDPITREEVLEELREMDNQVAVMKEDLRQNPNDERVVHTIINFYQDEIELMDMIIAKTTISNNTIL
jgi:hypothetical protein